MIAIPAVSAHGHVSGVVAGGKWYRGSDPNWIYEAEIPDRPGWYAYNQDEGYVGPSEYADSVRFARKFPGLINTLTNIF